MHNESGDVTALFETLFLALPMLHALCTQSSPKLLSSCACLA
jgi:hypothetical protein